MFKPSQYENINKSTMVLGADLLQKLKKQSYNIEDLFKELRKKKDININQFMTTVTFLWITDLIDYQDFSITLKK